MEFVDLRSGAYRMATRYDDRLTSDIYRNGAYLDLHPDWHVQDSSWKATQVIRFLRRNGLNPTSICEVGCGAGEILHQLSQRIGCGVTFVGYEISEQAFSLCQVRSQENVSFHLGDITRDPQSRFYDVV